MALLEVVTMNVQRIALVGPMGVGKSSVGRALTRMLDCPLVDLDKMIETEAGMTIREIFAREGETGFRLRESELLSRVTSETLETSLVLAAGGGIVTTAAAREVLGQHWTTIWLNAEPSTLLSHLQSETNHRPMLDSDSDLLSRIVQLASVREAWYRSVARFTVTVDGRDVDSIAREICQLGGWMTCSD